MYSSAALPDPHRHPQFYAGVTVKRFLAWIADSLVIAMMVFFVGIVTLTLAWWLWPLFYAAIGFLYRWATIASGSATWGMRLFGVELRDAHGESLDGATAFMHTLLYTVSLMFVLTQAISILLMLFSDRGQALHDLFLGTVAINRPGR